MTSKDAVLNIAVNLGRIARYIELDKPNRVHMFLRDNDQYISQVNTKNLKPNIKKSFEKAVALSDKINKGNPSTLVGDFYTYANILTHRAHLFT